MSRTYQVGTQLPSSMCLLTTLALMAVLSFAGIGCAPNAPPPRSVAPDTGGDQKPDAKPPLANDKPVGSAHSEANGAEDKDADVKHTGSVMPIYLTDDIVLQYDSIEFGGAVLGQGYALQSNGRFSAMKNPFSDVARQGIPPKTQHYVSTGFEQSDDLATEQKMLATTFRASLHAWFVGGDASVEDATSQLLSRDCFKTGLALNR